MALIIPAAIEAVIRQADTAAAAIDEVSFAGAIEKAAPPADGLTLEARRGAFAEIAAWRFIRPFVGGPIEREPWGIYWSPLASGTLKDGKAFHSPDVSDVDEEIVAHWIERVRTLAHPVLKARYADLSWEIGRYLKRPAEHRLNSPKPPIAVNIPVTLAFAAVDGYLDAIEGGLVGDEYGSWVLIDRAIGLSLSLRDTARARRAKDELFAYYRRMASEGTKFQWARLNDLLDGREKALAVTEAEHQEVIQSLETALAIHSDCSDKDRFDPHQATDAADRLVRHLGNNRAETQRVVKRAAAAFEEIAKSASGMLAIAWLEDLIPRYRNAGLVDDAARVEQAIRSRAEQARGEMKQISVPVEIPRGELDQWADAIAGATLKEALGSIAVNCMMREDQMRQSVQEMLEKAPLLSMMNIAVMGADGFTTATVRSVEDDLEGRSIQHAADRFNWNAPFLYHALNRIKEKHGCDLDALVAHLNEAPWFAAHREALLREGLAAWIAGDAVKSIHVLVPQLEAACRDLLAALGAPVRKFIPRTGGYEVIGLGEVLRHDVFCAGVPRDIRFHLRTLYSDARGINLRNHLAHGIANVGLFGMGLANWVVHSLLLLATLRVRERPVPGRASHDSRE